MLVFPLGLKYCILHNSFQLCNFSRLNTKLTFCRDRVKAIEKVLIEEKRFRNHFLILIHYCITPAYFYKWNKTFIIKKHK